MTTPASRMAAAQKNLPLHAQDLARAAAQTVRESNWEPTRDALLCLFATVEALIDATRDMIAERWREIGYTVDVNGDPTGRVFVRPLSTEE